MTVVDGTIAPGSIKFAAINATSDGDNTAVAAVTGFKIRVIGYMVMASAAGAVLFKSSTGGPTLATLAPAANGGAAYSGGSEAPAFETAASAALVINNAAGVDTTGHLAYVLV